MKFHNALLLASVTLFSGAAGQRTYLNPPQQAWTAASGGEIKAGNGLFVDPTGKTLVASFLDGSLGMYDAVTGSKIAKYTPTSTSGVVVQGYGGVTFAYTGTKPYIVYAVTENPTGQAQTYVFLTFVEELD
jgi:hypothetical protein